MSNKGGNNKSKKNPKGGEKKPFRQPMREAARGEVRTLDIHRCKSDLLLLNRWAQEMENWACINTLLISDIFTDHGFTREAEPTRPDNVGTDKLETSMYLDELKDHRRYTRNVEEQTRKAYGVVLTNLYNI